LYSLALGQALFTLRAENQFKPSYQPKVMWVEAEGDSQKASRFWVGDPYVKEESKIKEYLVSIDLAPGHYTLQNIFGVSQTLLVSGRFKYPAEVPFDVKDGSISYIGHIQMVNRQRNEGERASGKPLPLLDQRIAGYSTGTMEVTVSDRADADLAAFSRAYPGLRIEKVERTISKRLALAEPQ
jgi:hypothetical protein